MKKLIVALAALLMLLLVSEVHAASIDVSGVVSSNVTEASYGLTFYTFSFDVNWSSDNVTSGNITCVAVKNFGPLASAPNPGDSFNFTGQFITTQPDNNSVPVGVFLISYVNNQTAQNQTGNQTGQSGWMGALQGGFDFASSIGKWVVTFIVSAVQLGGITAPDYIVAFALLFVCGVLSFLRLKWYVTLSAYLLGLVVAAYILQVYVFLMLGIHF
jgi:hypothetical protein